MADLLAWWAVVEALGAVAVPYLFLTFRRLPDRGLACAKIAGVLLLGYLLWVSGTVGLVPNGRGAAVLSLCVLAAGALLLFRRQQRQIIAFARREWRAVLLYEAVFLLAFVAWAVVRAFDPAIDSTEKPMDFALLNTAVRSSSFPPADPWLSGHTVNYYYFGYVLIAGIVHLSGVAPAVAYNLALAFLFAAAATACWGIVANLVSLHGPAPRRRPRIGSRAMRYGAVGALLLVGIGNLEGALEVVRWHGGGSPAFWQWAGIKGEADPGTGRMQFVGVRPGQAGMGPAGPPGAGVSPWYPTDGWWWWRATRVIDTVVDGESRDYTITEFPLFSFLLGDLHPHVLALPVALLAIALALEVLLSPARRAPPGVRRSRVLLLAGALVIGGLGFTNGWDLVPYAGLFTGAALARVVGSGEGLRNWRRYAAWIALAGLGMLLLYAPFYLRVGAQVFGPLLGAGAATTQGFPLALWLGPGTRPFHFLLIWAPFALAGGAFLVMAARGTSRRLASWTAGGLSVVILAWVVTETVGLGRDPSQPSVAHRIWFFVPAALALVLAWRTVGGPGGVRTAGRRPATAFCLLLLAAAFLLFALSESVHVRDVFGNRMNTVFKLYYQAWAMLAVVAAFAVSYCSLRPGRQEGGRPWARQALSVALVLVAGAAMVYTPAAVLAKTQAFSAAPTLNGLAYLERLDPDEAEALAWLSSEVRGDGVVVLEATGGQYSRYGRVSSNTGIPTVLGWAGHELQWRGNDEAFRGRPEDIDRMYTVEEKRLITPLLRKYGVDYVYVGALERQKYPAPGLDGFSGTFETVFENASVTIYQVQLPLEGA